MSAIYRCGLPFALVAGVGLGIALPESIRADRQRIEYASVNLVVAVFIWVMIYPMMVNVDFASLKDVGKKPRGLDYHAGTVNWLIKPFTMAALGILFFEHVFAGMVDPQTAKEYIAGMILLGVAPCTAMVFVWSQLVRGDANYTLVQVSINDIIMVFAFAPIAAFLLGVTDIVVPWQTLLLSVILYVVIPLAAGYITRRIARRHSANHERVASFTAKAKPFSIMGLLATVILLFGFQAQTIIDKPHGHRPDRHSSADPDLRYFSPGLRLGVSVARAIQYGCASSIDRHVELLRTGRGGRNQPVWPEFRRRAGDRRRRAR